MANKKSNESDSREYIFTPWITVKGKRIYHPTGGVFRIPLNKLKRRKRK